MYTSHSVGCKVIGSVLLAGAANATPSFVNWDVLQQNNLDIFCYQHWKICHLISELRRAISYQNSNLILEGSARLDARLDVCQWHGCSVLYLFHSKT